MRRWLRWLFHGVGGSLSLALSALTAGVVVSAAALVWWSGSEGSLAQTVRLLEPFLPSGQSLSAQSVTGSLRSGGRIGHWVWKRAHLTLEGQDLELTWDWQAALRGELLLNRVHAGALHVQDRTPANEDPWTAMRLPMHVDAQVTVDRLVWAGTANLQLSGVQGRYRYDGATHHLMRFAAQMASGTYQLDGTLQAAEPGALQLALTGTVAAPLRAKQQTVPLTANASVSGNLMGKGAALELLLDLRPAALKKDTALGAMEMHVQATLAPAASQPVVRAQAHWQSLDIARLWPQFPQTALTGQAQVQPDGGGWKAEVQLQNSKAGPLDKGLLPVSQVSASVQYSDAHWQLRALQAQVGGGRISGEGRYGGTPAAWAVHGVLEGVDTATLDSRWTPSVLRGETTLQPTPLGIAFEAQLHSVSNRHAAALAADVRAKGLWRAPALVLDSLELQSTDARLIAHAEFDSGSGAVRGQLQAELPGAQGSFEGHLSAQQGQGSTRWRVSDAAALSQWLARLPWLGDTLQGLDLAGNGEAGLQWQGGWQDRGRDLHLEAFVRSPDMAAQGLRLSDFQAEAKGSLQALEVTLHTKAQVGPAAVFAQAQSNLSHSAEGQWQALVRTAHATVADGLQPVFWNLQLQRPLTLQWQRSALLQTLSVGAGSVDLTGPAPGMAQLLWEPVQWSQRQEQASSWSSKGSLQGLPLAWLEALGQTRLANLGLRGDLLFGGAWDAHGGDGLAMHVRVQRSSGDLQLLSGDATGGSLPAGLREALLELRVARDDVQLHMVWDSDAGGQAQADFSSRLQRDGGTSQWPSDAPLRGKVRASLPRVGAWSLFAPVGWRINGTLEADATVEGTRANPLWKGTLDARDMAIRSVVDGIDLSGGVMRLRLDGRHMEVAEFSVQGAGGAQGGQLTASGSVDWLPAVAGVPVAKRLRMALDATAQTFRVTARPDQRLVVSGNLSARLQDAKLALHGALVADQALIVLPEDTAPRLGSDVNVRRSQTGKKTVAAGPDPATSLARALTPDLQVTLDPGPNFQLQGHGINTRLAGQLTLKAKGKDASPQLAGELRAVNGYYRAYGQRLSIEEGTLRFNGAYDNPVLNIRAVRPNLQQVVGVQVSGTAQLPVVRLFSEPELSEMEKLSWLVLGRSSANSGSETAILQQAALALIAGNKSSRSESVINAVGLDEVSLGQVATTNLDGTAGTEATVKFGKRLSRDFYVAYERSLAGTLGTLYVFYDLSRRFTLRGESGANNAVDLIFTSRFD